MYYLGSIPDPICVCKKWKPGRVSHKPSATGWSKSWHLEGQVTKQRMQRSWVMGGVDNSPSPLRPSWAEDNMRPWIVPNTLLVSRPWGPQSSPPWTGRLQSQWENRRWLVAATVLKLSQWRQARTERDSSRKVWRTPLKHFCILTSQVPSRSFQGSWLVHTVAFLEKFVPFPSVNHKVPPHDFSNGSCKKTGKELQQATTATRLFYKLAQRAPPLSPDVRGPTVHPLRLLLLDFFYFLEGLVPLF